VSVTGKAELRDRFNTQFDSLTATSKILGDSLKGVARRVNHKIDKHQWSGNVYDLDGISSAFSRDENAADVAAALADVADPGNFGDLMVSSMQGDYLACMERAFRSRNASRVRRTIHAAARRAGHGHESGILQRGVKGYLEAILRFAKDIGQ